MPWVEIPKDKIPSLSMFGYELIQNTETGAWYCHEEVGKILVEYAKPFVWTSDVGEAGQLDAVSIFQSQH